MPSPIGLTRDKRLPRGAGFHEVIIIDDAFWLCYLRAHADPRTRRLHVAGTTLATAMLAAAVLRHDLRLAVAALVCGYGPAWFAHAFIERNRPETLRAPFRSLAADYRMGWRILNDTLESELERAHANVPDVAR